MSFRLLGILSACVVLAGCSSPQPQTTKGFHEYCFPATKLRVEKITSSPAGFLVSHPQAAAAINGVYWGADDNEPQGLVYADNTRLTSTKGLISGYMVVNAHGQVSSGVVLADAVVRGITTGTSDASAVIGTHPLLITHGAVHEQALLPRYDKTEFRSTLGTTTGTNVCFAVYTAPLTMQEWAHELVSRGYRDAINLDGGPVSQLAIRTEGAIELYGSGVIETRLIFYAAD